MDLAIGMDVGSTTVKAVVVHPTTRACLWHAYERHQTRQPETMLAFLERIFAAFPDQPADRWRLFLTGSGAGPLCDPTGGAFVQEVNAVTLAVEQTHPDVLSVVELGGQDAKIILFKQDRTTGQRTATASMNDKCASGTGATIDKCLIKVGADPGFAAALRFDAATLHHVAAKCGVFAETDIVNLVKAGIPKGEVLNSLADAIVLQNLSVLTRGSTLKPRVLLLGGPNTYLPFLRDCWRHRIPETWRDRGIDYPKDVPIEELIFVPPNAELYAALGAAYYGLAQDDAVGRLHDLDSMRTFIAHGRRARLGDQAGPPLSASAEDTRRFVEQYRLAPFEGARFQAGDTVRAVIGLDGGSTSSKAVLLGEDGRVLAKAYQLSKGNPILDAQELLRQIEQQVEGQGARIECLGFGATGYAADVLESCLAADVNVVETVAHMISALHFFPDVDVVCDVGGQDIKILFLKNGDIQGFKLSNSCSAGNGMLLQAMADQFGIPVTEYAEYAFRAELSPRFSYGCAVFLDSDRVTFQKEGYQKEELLAGLAMVLPKNIWQYVAQMPRLAALGRTFVLQGGTQYNLAAVKAEVDYIQQRVPGVEVFVHPHTGEAGAIGAALETLRRWRRTGRSTFIGLAAAHALEYTTRNDATTVCHFCANECKRTFVDARRPDGGSSRYISGFSCEKGTVESKEALRDIVAERKKLASAYPNLVEYEARRAFAHIHEPAPLPPAGMSIKDVRVTTGLFRQRRETYTRPFARSGEAAAARRRQVRIGMPRVLNMYSTAPFFRTYFEALGLASAQIVFSSPTSEEMWAEGGKYGSIDPCFPSKVVQAHVHELLFHKHQPERGTPLHYIFFPILTHLPSFVADTVDNACCPIVAGTPDVIKAAFMKEQDYFAARGIEYVAPALTFAEASLLARRMFETWGARLEITEDESDHACREGWRALAAFDADLQEKGRAILETVEAEDRIAILVLARPYHSDPGLNHGVPEEFQARGYPILSIRSVPKDRAFLDRHFQDEIESGLVATPLQLGHVWPENYSANSAQKVWGANFAAHHPNVAVLDLSSFKCGHDAPTYGLIDTVLQTAKTPTAALHDLDATKPGGSILIRVKTYAHSLRLQQERLEALATRKRALTQAIDEKRLALLRLRQGQLSGPDRQDPAIAREIDQLKERMRAYRVANLPADRPAGRSADTQGDAADAGLPRGLIHLQRQLPDGSLVPVGVKGASTPCL